MDHGHAVVSCKYVIFNMVCVYVGWGVVKSMTIRVRHGDAVEL